jgi:levoglucosan dehydrogenase
MTPPLRIGMVGGGFMARTHSLAYAAASMLDPTGIPRVARVRIADVTEDLAERAARALGWAESTADRTAITRAADVDLVDVVTPNFAHAEAAVDAAAHGKHVICEKPLATTLADARVMYRAVRDARVRSGVGFMFRTWPAVQLARELIADGTIGTPHSFRGHYFHDYALDPTHPASWRLRKATSGGGSVADIGSHVFDLCRLLLGEVDRVHCRSRTHMPQRPNPETGTMETIEVDDASDVLLELVCGATGVVQTNWMAAGYKTDLAFEVLGSAGAVRFSWQRNGELDLYEAGASATAQGFRTIVIGPQHRGAGRFWPVAGQGLGYGDGFTILLAEVLAGVAGAESVAPTFLDGVRAAEIVAAAQESATSGAWVPVDRMPVDG